MSAEIGLRRAAAWMLVLVALGGAAGCGSNSDDQRLKAEELAAAKAEGRREARAEAKVADAAAEAKRLQKEIDNLKKSDRSGGSKSGGSRAPSSRAATPAAAPSSGSTSCGDGLSVNGNTSCPFAENVREEYRSSGGGSTISAFSPATGRVISMSCRGGVPTVCSGGDNAVVYIR
jgi:hypothetical protein